MDVLRIAVGGTERDGDGILDGGIAVPVPVDHLHIEISADRNRFERHERRVGKPNRAVAVAEHRHRIGPDVRTLVGIREGRPDILRERSVHDARLRERIGNVGFRGEGCEECIGRSRYLRKDLVLRLARRRVREPDRIRLDSQRITIQSAVDESDPHRLTFGEECDSSRARRVGDLERHRRQARHNKRGRIDDRVRRVLDVRVRDCDRVARTDIELSGAGRRVRGIGGRRHRVDVEPALVDGRFRQRLHFRLARALVLECHLNRLECPDVGVLVGVSHNHLDAVADRDGFRRLRDGTDRTDPGRHREAVIDVVRRVVDRMPHPDLVDAGRVRRRRSPETIACESARRIQGDRSLEGEGALRIISVEDDPDHDRVLVRGERGAAEIDRLALFIGSRVREIREVSSVVDEAVRASRRAVLEVRGRHDLCSGEDRRFAADGRAVQIALDGNFRRSRPIKHPERSRLVDVLRASAGNLQAGNRESVREIDIAVPADVRKGDLFNPDRVDTARLVGIVDFVVDDAVAEVLVVIRVVANANSVVRWLGCQADGPVRESVHVHVEPEHPALLMDRVGAVLPCDRIRRI